VVGRDDRGAGGGYPLASDDVHAAIEDGGEEPGEAPDEPVRCGGARSAQTVTRWPSSAAAAFQPSWLVIAACSAAAAPGSPCTI
jgi:hypothetical protein